ncbi:OLC1v1004175C1 [Oldenlandia corymbosa var. corymbosa]|uniref:Exocyst subunit Exo70 family protein n=1 Tax=Oldenlandia corymbosa var. corymbosa TaxID=529605 RepID=A0AAV1DED2_OLDCO|nr:OLC1v1004175C1 [Oldenlandia corymbosa var. corymbosa]
MKNVLIRISLEDNSSVSSSHHTSATGRTFSETIMVEDIENAEQIIRKWDLDSRPTLTDSSYNNSPTLFTTGEAQLEARKFFGAISDLRHAMRYFHEDDSGSPMLVRAHNLMEIAMKRLEKEFHTILKTHRTTILSPESVSGRSTNHRRYYSRHSSSAGSRFSDEEGNSDDGESFDFESFKSSLIESSEADKETELVMANLKSIADCMIGSGYGKECVYIYKIIRKSIVDEALYNLGVDKSEYSQSQVSKLGWDALEIKIKKWRPAVRTAVKTLFHGERVLSDHVFSSSKSIRESCFAEISKDGALTLFTFPENVTKNKKIYSPEKIFRFLDMYEDISELWADVETVFSSDYFSAVKSQATNSLLKLGEAVRVMLSQFESAIEKETSKTAVPGGGIHPLTRYVMNYLVLLSDYSGPVADIIADWPSAPHTPLPASYFASPISVVGGGVEDSSPGAALSVRLAWIILVLLCKLDSKAGLYREHVALSYLFLANNLNYVVSKIRTSNLVLLMGSDWIFSHESKVKQYVEKYEKIGWGKTLASLPDDPMADTPSRKVIDCFEQFNSGFEEAYRAQSSWVIPDPNLRDEVKVSIFKKLVAPYRVFYQQYRKIAEGSIVRYAPEDLENYLSDLFFGNSISGGSSRSRSPSQSPPSSSRGW